MIKSQKYSLISWVLLCFAAVLIVGGCASSTGSSGEAEPAFPKERYLTAKGIGKSEIDARNQAMAQLSSIFEAEIFSQFSSTSNTRLSPDQAETFTTAAESKIRVASRVRLEGIRIGKSVKDEKTGEYHALAVLDRVDAGQNWADRVQLLDAGIEAEKKALENIKGPLSRMAALNRIMALAADRMIIESRLRVVDYPVMDLYEIDLGQVMAEQSGLMSNLKVFVGIQGEEGYRIEGILAQGLTQKGIALAADPDQADARMLGQVHLTDLSLENPNARFVRVQGEVLVFETRPQTLFIQISENIRTAHKDPAEARHKAIEAMGETLSRRLLSALGYGDN